MLWFTIGSVLSALASYIGIAALAAWRFTTPRRRTPSPDPATAGLRFEDTWFSARGEPVTIAAWHLPAPQATRGLLSRTGLAAAGGKNSLSARTSCSNIWLNAASPCSCSICAAMARAVLRQ